MPAPPGISGCQGNSGSLSPGGDCALAVERNRADRADEKRREQSRFLVGVAVAEAGANDGGCRSGYRLLVPGVRISGSASSEGSCERGVPADHRKKRHARGVDGSTGICLGETVNRSLRDDSGRVGGEIKPDLFGVGLSDAKKRKIALFRRNFDLIGDSVRGNHSCGFRGHVSFLIFSSNGPFQSDAAITGDNFHVVGIGGK